MLLSSCLYEDVVKCSDYQQVTSCERRLLELAHADQRLKLNGRLCLRLHLVRYKRLMKKLHLHCVRVMASRSESDALQQKFLLSRHWPWITSTGSSAIAEGPRDALSQLKSCQLLHNCPKNHI